MRELIVLDEASELCVCEADISHEPRTNEKEEFNVVVLILVGLFTFVRSFVCLLVGLLTANKQANTQHNCVCLLLFIQHTASSRLTEFGEKKKSSPAKVRQQQQQPINFI